MRIIFIGIHNKPGLQPLDSSTKSGRYVDKIISKLKTYQLMNGFEYVKSNIFEVEYQPQNRQEILSLRRKWWDKYNPHKNDIFILLGKIVQYNFYYNAPSRFWLDAIHPSSLWSKESQLHQQKEIVDHIINQLYYGSNLIKA